MAPRMHIETAGSPEPETGTNATAVAPAPQAAAPAVQAPKPKVDAPAGVVASAAPANPEPGTGGAKAVVSGASAPKPVAGVAKPKAPTTTGSVRPQVKVSPVVEEAPATDVEGTYEFAGDGASQKAAGAPRQIATAPADASAGNAAPKSPQSLTGWVQRTFPGHVHAFWGAVIAFVMALLTFVIGLPRMILIAILVLIGVALGQVLDGDPKIIRTIRDLFSSDRER